MTSRKIDMTPSWSAILPTILMVLEHAETEDAKEAMRVELRRMAALADSWAEHVRREARVKKVIG